VPKTIENRDTRRKEIVPPENSVQPIAEVFIFKTNRRLNRLAGCAPDERNSQMYAGVRESVRMQIASDQEEAADSVMSGFLQAARRS
jgi:hypothetical protein